MKNDALNIAYEIIEEEFDERVMQAVGNYFDADDVVGFAVNAICLEEFDYIEEFVGEEDAITISEYYNLHCGGNVYIPEKDEDEDDEINEDAKKSIDEHERLYGADGLYAIGYEDEED